jgi:predicted O-methyltransferase YrrM
MTFDPALASLAARTKGFMPDDEAAALRGAAAAAAPGLWLEIGSYCGKSTVHLGAVAAERGSHLVTLDHHHGSEENQPGWTWHDQSLVDPRTGRLDTLPSLRRTLGDADLESAVSVLVATTQQVAPWWTSPLTLLFLDGGHTEETAQHDYAGFARHLLPDGVLAVHDVFPDPRDGGQPPWHVVQRALSEGTFTQVGVYGSLRVLRRTRETPVQTGGLAAPGTPRSSPAQTSSPS